MSNITYQTNQDPEIKAHLQRSYYKEIEALQAMGFEPWLVVEDSIPSL